MRAGWGRRIVRTIGTGIVAVVAALVGAAGLAAAGDPPPNAPIIVTTTADVVDPDDGETSLREAFDRSEAQPGHDEIVLVPGEVHHVTSCGINDEAFADEASSGGVTITGGGATIDSSCTGRVLDLAGGPSLVEDLTISGEGDEEVVWLVEGDLVDVTFLGLSDDAGEPSSMAILDHGTAERVRFEGNDGFGVLLHLWGNEGDAADADGVTMVDNEVQLGLVSEVPTSVARVLATENTFEVGAIGLPAGSTLTSSAVVGNVGPAVRGFPAGAGADPTGLAVADTTVAGNSTSDGDGAAIDSQVPLSFAHVTVSQNEHTDSAQHVLEVRAPALTSFGSIIGEQRVEPACAVDQVTSGGRNLAAQDCGLDHASDVVEQGWFALGAPEPAVGPGYATAVVRPEPGSPALDAIPIATCTATQQDQRGVSRPQGPACDIGAYEVEVAFRDVTGNHPFHRQITWAHRRGIAGGYADGTFRPAAPVSRGAMAAFLHRFAGDDPVVLPGTPSFPDVTLQHPFAEDVEWLAAEGIAGGYVDGTFRPAAPVSRAAMAAFLHRWRGDDPVVRPGAPTFPDVPFDHPFSDDVEWLAAEGIAGGYVDGTFRPTAPVSRGAMAVFLHRVAEDA